MGGFNESQLRAITTDSKYILCLAGAGTGKTTVLTSRIANLYSNRVSCNNMLALTFTRLAGNEMKERVIKIIGEKEGKKLFCNTFHSFCVKVLKEYGYLIGYGKDFSVYDEQDKLSIIDTIIKDLFLKAKVEDVIEVIEKEIKKEDNPKLADAFTAADEYKYRLKRNNAVDLDMLLTETRKILKSFPEVQAYYHDLYEYVFIDEFQDTNKVQMEIIQLLDPQNLFVVGDDAQSIYGWRGTELKYILEFEQEYPGCEVIKLEENYRSSTAIIDAANTVIAHNKSQTDKVLRARRDGYPIEYIETENEEGEANAVVERIFEYGDPFKDSAILARTNSQLRIFTQVFRKYDIPYKLVSSREDVFKKGDIRMVINFIDSCINNKDDITIKKIINFPEQRLTSEQITKLELRALERELSIYEGLKKFTFKQPSDEKVNALLNAITAVDNYIHEEEDNALKVFNYTVEALKLNRFYNSSDRASKIDVLVEASQRITSWMNRQYALGESLSISTFLKYLRIKDIQERLAEENSDTVKLMTVHAAKGLEFNNVFVVGLNQDVFPNKRGDIEEERRLYYVAITRAKERLVITRPRHVALTYMKGERETVRSQFIGQ